MKRFATIAAMVAIAGSMTLSAQVNFQLNAGTDGVNVSVGSYPGWYAPAPPPPHWHSHKSSKKARKYAKKARKHYKEAIKNARKAAKYSHGSPWGKPRKGHKHDD